MSFRGRRAPRLSLTTINSISAKIFTFCQKQIRSVRLEFFVPAKSKTRRFRFISLRYGTIGSESRGEGQTEGACALATRRYAAAEIQYVELFFFHPKQDNNVSTKELD